MVTFNERDAIREGYGKPRSRFRHPARQAQALATSGAGIVHREMMDLQRQPELNKADTGRLKELRRDWNRNRKYTDAGMSLAGVTTPMGAQDAFMRSTEDFRQLNKPAYNQMYPLTGGFMDYADKGGLWGSLLSGLAGKTKKRVKDFMAGDGITSLAAGDTKEDKERYITETFGPNMYDRAGPWFGTAPIEDVEISDLEGEPSLVPDVFTPEVETREGQIQGLKDEIQEQIDNFENPFPLLPTQKDTDDMVFADVPEKYEDYIERGLQEPLPFDEGREDYIRRQNEYVSPVSAPLGIPNPQGDFDKFQEYPYPEIGIEFGGEPIPPIIPFDDAGREAGIASLYGQGPMWGETDRRYEDEYRDHVERTGDRMTYEEFERAWERMHALPKGLHFQEPRAGIR